MCLVVDCVERCVKLVNNDHDNPKYCLLQKLTGLIFNCTIDVYPVFSLMEMLKFLFLMILQADSNSKDYFSCIVVVRFDAYPQRNYIENNWIVFKNVQFSVERRLNLSRGMCSAGYCACINLTDLADSLRL
ncbi:unnamed protein product [Anisakis simplex]|uniref:Ovule protein n=1 Tax=Anisakis simplex TaxID=6269 RepID=A0A0M3JBB6_ANISI|nr:unnamed protein product [Anisakis simplex]